MQSSCSLKEVVKDKKSKFHGLCLILQVKGVELQYHNQPVDRCGAVSGEKNVATLF